ncbi:unnamed protein product [Brassica rapa]|uniref:Uncharacterized protein n=1 Tax=Brassica campestris TaxID=3711 RepID=A0A8D9D300_BRACM|nr:unnamed protein product [Brassica rapa]
MEESFLEFMDVVVLPSMPLGLTSRLVLVKKSPGSTEKLVISFIRSEFFIANYRLAI